MRCCLGKNALQRVDQRQQRLLDGRGQLFNGFAYVGAQLVHQLPQPLDQCWDDLLQPRYDVARRRLDALHQVLHQRVKVLLRVGHAGQKILPGRLHAVHTALDRALGLPRCRPHDAHVVLHHMDRRHNILKAQTIGVHRDAQLVLHICQSCRVCYQPLHLRLRATIPKLQIVQHGIVLLCESLVGILEACHVRAKLVHVVAHVHNGHVGVLCGLLGVPAQRGHQACRKARRGLHVGIGGQARGLPAVPCIFQHGFLAAQQAVVLVSHLGHALVYALGVFLHAARFSAKQRFHAAHKLLVVAVALQAAFGQTHKGAAKLLYHIHRFADGRLDGIA